MKARQSAIATIASLFLTLTAQAQTTTLDWKFNNSANPAPPTTSDTTATATASFLQGNDRWLQVGPLGLYGTDNTGLWSMERSGTTVPQLELKLDRTPETSVGLQLVVTHFVDNAQFPGTFSFSVPGVSYDGRTLVTPQTGDMIGFWVADTFSWTGVTYPGSWGGPNGMPITLSIFPGGDKSLLLDEVKWSILGAVSTVPEPMAGQLAGLGLLLFGLRSWLRRRA